MRHARAPTAGRNRPLGDVDPHGQRFGEPAILITRLAGHADITPVNPHDAATVGRVLARIHAVPVEPCRSPTRRPRHPRPHWSGAAGAPRGFDLSRLDLILLHGESVADTFLTAYEQAAQVKVPEIARWDLLAVTKSYETVETWEPNYQSLGRLDLTAAQPAHPPHRVDRQPAPELSGLSFRATRQWEGGITRR